MTRGAIQDDVDGIRLSALSGAHMTLFPRVVDLLRERGAEDVVVFGGGIIPDDDIPKVKEKGLSEIFTPGTPLAVAMRQGLADHGQVGGGAGADDPT